MADTEEQKKAPQSKKLGQYMVASGGAINTAIEKQIASYTKGEKVKRIGELLLEQGIISEEELNSSVRNQRITRLGSCPIFASLTSTELASLSKHFMEVSVSPGEQFIMQGEDDPSLFIIATGEVEVFRLDNAGNEIPIAVVGPGEPIGEMGYFSGGKRSASVRALNAVQLLRAEYKNLTRYFEDVPRVALAFTEVVNHRRQEMEAKMDTAEK